MFRGDGVREPDDIAREICRHCATAELREGNAAVALTSPCYNGVRSLFVAGRFTVSVLLPWQQRSVSF